jgi:hypothetical protein
MASPSKESQAPVKLPGFGLPLDHKNPYEFMNALDYVNLEEYKIECVLLTSTSLLRRHL